LGDATTTVDTYKVGTLVVDLFDAKTEKLIWAESSSSDTLSNNADKNTKNLGKRREQNVPAIFPPRPRRRTLRGSEMNCGLDVFTRYLNDPEYPGHSSARGKQAARGNGQPEHGGLDQPTISKDSMFPGLISIVGGMNEENAKVGHLRRKPYVKNPGTRSGMRTSSEGCRDETRNARQNSAP